MSQVTPPYPQQPQVGHPPQPYPGEHPPGDPGAAPDFGRPPAPGSTPAADIRPRSRWFWIGGGIILASIIAAVIVGVLGFLGIASTVDDFSRVPPGTDMVQLDSPGQYVIYTEDGSFFSSIRITSPDGDPVDTSRYQTGLTYEFNGRSGQAVATFQADDAGRYTIETDTHVAIGPSIAGKLLRTILIPFAIVGIGIVAGLIVIIVTAVKRSGAKKRSAAGSY